MKTTFSWFEALVLLLILLMSVEHSALAASRPATAVTLHGWPMLHSSGCAG